MSKATLSYTLPEEREEFMAAASALDLLSAIHEIGEEIFRPARKHGYSDAEINRLLEACGDSGTELVAALEAKYYEIISELSINR